MTFDDFTDLAFRRLENPSDAALRTELDQALAQHPEWTEEWRALRDTHAQFAEALPIAHELNTPAPSASETPPVPWEKLQPATRPPRRWWTTLVPAAAAAIVLLLWTQFTARTETLPTAEVIARVASLDPSLAAALRAPLPELLMSLQPATLRDSSASADAWIQQPFGAAQSGPVTVTWTGGPADLTLRQRGQIIWQAKQATSPTLTDTLPADGVYELSIVLTSPTPADLRTRFITVAANAETDASLGPFAPIVAPLASSPARLGEAAAAWRELTVAQKTSPVGLRLGLWLGVNARQPDIWAEAKHAASPQDP